MLSMTQRNPLVFSYSISTRFLVRALFLCLLTVWTFPARAEVKAVTLLHTNDLHARFDPHPDGSGGIANLAAYIQSVRKQRPGQVLLLDAGDNTLGTSLCVLFDGEPIYDLMNRLGYNVRTLGNHEFDYGVEKIARFRSFARFPVVCANAFHNGQLIADEATTVLNVNGLKVGVLGLTIPFSQKDPTVEFKDLHDTAARYLPDLRARSQILVALTHIGVENDRTLARDFPDLDFIIGGHSHTEMDKPVEEGKTWIVQTGAYGKRVGQLDLEFDTETNRIVSRAWKIVPLPAPGLAPDAAILKRLQEWEAKIPQEVSAPIGFNPRPLAIPEVKAEIERIWRETFQTDFALQNVGATRVALPAGSIRESHIWDCMPFDNTLVILQLTADQVAEERGQTRFSEKKPLYSVVTNNYFADQLIKKYRLPESQVKRLDFSWRKPVLDYIKANGGLLTPNETDESITTGKP
jgi:2',3'-cyclic-nucleotide 2'-phosphodiesterase (5'-nucleotidase family)